LFNIPLEKKNTTALKAYIGVPEKRTKHSKTKEIMIITALANKIVLSN
jgi:hypothetical protein